MLEDDRFKAAHDLGGLLRMTARTHAEIRIRLGNFQLSKEYVRHIPVVMLAGMNQYLPDAAPLQAPQNGRRFHEVRPGSYNMKNMPN